MAQSNLQRYIAGARQGTAASVGAVVECLNARMTLAESKFIDYALSHVETEAGVAALARYLFSGTQVQRNYCALFFARRGDYEIVRRAYDRGLVDARQAFSR